LFEGLIKYLRERNETDPQRTTSSGVKGIFDFLLFIWGHNSNLTLSMEVQEEGMGVEEEFVFL